MLPCAAFIRISVRLCRIRTSSPPPPPPPFHVAMDVPLTGQCKMQTADYCLRDANENVTTAVPLFSNPKNNSPLSVCSLLFPLPHRKQEEIMLKTRHACLPLENCWDTRGRTLNTPTNSKSSNTIWGFKLSLERDREYKELLSSADIIFTGVLKMSRSQRSMFFSCFQQLHHFKTNHFSEFQVKSLGGPSFYERRPVLNAKLLVPACLPVMAAILDEWGRSGSED